MLNKKKKRKKKKKINNDRKMYVRKSTDYMKNILVQYAPKQITLKFKSPSNMNASTNICNSGWSWKHNNVFVLIDCQKTPNSANNAGKRFIAELPNNLEKCFKSHQQLTKMNLSLTST